MIHSLRFAVRTSLWRRGPSDAERLSRLIDCLMIRLSLVLKLNCRRNRSILVGYILNIVVKLKLECLGL